MDDERRRVIDEARETIERVSEFAPPIPEMEDRLTRWRRLATQRQQERKQAKAELVTSKQADWSEIDARIAAAIAAERAFLGQSIGEAMALLLDDERRDVMKKTRDEMRELRIETAKLSSEVAELRATLAEAKARERGVDPANLARRIN